MKNQIFILKLVLVGLAITSCGNKYLPTGEVEFVNDSSETMTVSATGYGGTSQKALQDAEIRTFDNLLFRGIAGSQQYRPMVKDETSSKKSNSTFYADFFDQGYKKYIVSSNVTSRHRKAGKSGVKAAIQINMFSLRSALEKEGIIREFGL